MLEKNKPVYQFINKMSYWLLLLIRKRPKKIHKEELSPIWVTGMFRSGTSLTTQILATLEVDLGPDDHLLKAKGSRRNLNPNGFFENYIFMDWSLKVFLQLDSWGHEPPTLKQVREYSQTIDFKNFAHHSIVDIHDDRISNRNKVGALRKYSPENFDQYLQECFSAPMAIKNPHFALIYPLLLKQWPKSKFLVVFRNPDDTIASAKSVTPTADYDLYFDYYSRILLDEDVKAVYISYEKLVSNPAKSIKALVAEFKLDDDNLSSAADLIDHNQSKSTNSEKGNWPQQIVDLYAEMNERAINK